MSGLNTIRVVHFSLALTRACTACTRTLPGPISKRPLSRDYHVLITDTALISEKRAGEILLQGELTLLLVVVVDVKGDGDVVGGIITPGHIYQDEARPAVSEIVAAEIAARIVLGAEFHV